MLLPIGSCLNQFFEKGVLTYSPRYCAFCFANSWLLKVFHILPWSLWLNRCSVMIFVRGFDFSYQVLKLIPNEWSIGLISQFLSGSVRLSLHKSRTTKILSGLAREENLKVSMMLGKNMKSVRSKQQEWDKTLLCYIDLANLGHLMLPFFFCPGTILSICVVNCAQTASSVCGNVCNL